MVARFACVGGRMAPQPQSPRNQAQCRAQILDQLLRSERDRLLRQVRLHSRRRQDAEDALSDACVQFLRYYDGPPGEPALYWMLLVTKRCAWAITRQARLREDRSQFVPIERAGEELAIVVREERIGPAELVERSEETARVIESIEQLKPDERTALILLGLGCSYAEIAELRGWSSRKVNRCVSEGRARVRDLLERGEG